VCNPVATISLCLLTHAYGLGWSGGGEVPGLDAAEGVVLEERELEGVLEAEAPVVNEAVGEALRVEEALMWCWVWKQQWV
jgi:hypothetical protein